MPLMHSGFRKSVVVLIVLGLAGPAAWAEERVIPSNDCMGLWIVPVSYGDDPDQTLHLVLDTGASHSAVDPDSIRRATGRKARAGKKVKLKNGSAGPLALRKITVEVHEMDHLMRVIGAPMDGILGFDTFRGMLLTLDYPKREVRVSRGSLPEPDNETVFRDYGKSRPYLAVPVGDERVAVLVDSGSTGELTLRESDDLHWEFEPVEVRASVRYKGIRLDRAGRLADDLIYGPLTLEKPVTEVVEDGTRLAGFKILRRFVWTFDGKSKRIRMLPDSDTPIHSEPARGHGLALRPIEEGLEVARVFPGMPGEQAGLRIGDVIVAIDGEPVWERGCVSVNDAGAEPTSTWSVDRNGEILDVEITSRVLVP